MADLNRKGDLEVNIVDKTTQDKAGVTDENRLKVDSKFTVSPDIEYKGKLIIRHLILDGSEPYTFTKGSMNVDGSSTVKNFYRTPPSGKKWYIGRVQITIEGSSINHVKFGSIAALTNGILFKVTENGTERDFYEHSVRDNGSFYHLASNVYIESATTDIIVIDYNFLQTGSAVLLKNSTSDNFKIVVQDDLTSIDFMECVIFGYEVDE